MTTINIIVYYLCHIKLFEKSIAFLFYLINKTLKNLWNMSVYIEIIFHFIYTCLSINQPWRKKRSLDWCRISSRTTIKAPFIFFSFSYTQKKKRDVYLLIRAKHIQKHKLSFAGCFLALHILYIYIYMWMFATDADNHTSASIRRLHINVVFINRVLSHAWRWRHDNICNR